MGESGREKSLVKVLGRGEGSSRVFPSGGGAASGAAIIVSIRGEAYIGISICIHRRIIQKLELY